MPDQNQSRILSREELIAAMEATNGPIGLSRLLRRNDEALRAEVDRLRVENDRLKEQVRTLRECLADFIRCQEDYAGLFQEENPGREIYEGGVMFRARATLSDSPSESAPAVCKTCGGKKWIQGEPRTFETDGAAEFMRQTKSGDRKTASTKRDQFTGLCKNCGHRITFCGRPFTADVKCNKCSYINSFKSSLQPADCWPIANNGDRPFLS